MDDWPKKVLIGTDGSEDAALGTRAAIALSNEAGAELHVVHVWRRPQAPSLARPGLAYPAREATGYSDMLEREAKELLEEQAGPIRAAGGTLARAHLKEGRATEEIPGLAEELGGELVVVGSRGIGTVRRLTTGNDSTDVLKAVSGSVPIAPAAKEESRPSARTRPGAVDKPRHSEGRE